MSLHVYPEMEQRSDSWYAARCGIVTASAVGALLTPTGRVADNEHARNLTALLVAERLTGIVDPTFTNDDMWRGIEEEPRARERYAEVNKVEVTEVGFMVLDGDGWQLGYSPDGLVGHDGLLEVKAPRAKGHLQTILADAVPDKHMAQLQAGLFVSGRKWIDFVSWHAGMPMFTKRVLPNHDWFFAIEKAVMKFEETAAEMVAAYQSRTKGLPATERLSMEIV